MFNNQARAERKYRDREQQRAAANRRIGHDLAYWIVLGPGVKRAAVAAAAAVVVWWAWHEVPHAEIAGWLAGAGVLLLIAYGARNVAGSNPRTRMLERAAGVSSPGLRWNRIGAAGGLLLLAAFLVWRSL